MTLDEKKAWLASRKPVVDVTEWDAAELGAKTGEVLANTAIAAMEFGDKALDFVDALWTSARFTWATRNTAAK